MDREYGLTEDGLLLPPTATVLDSPDAFEPGPRGVYNEPTSEEFAEKMVRPTWYVLHDDAGGTVQGSRVPGDGHRAMVVQVGSNPDDRTHLYLYGRLKEGVSSRSVLERPHVGLSGQIVWKQHITASNGDQWTIDMYNDGSGYSWKIPEDSAHAEIGMQQRHPTTMHALAAAVQHLQEDGVPGLIPIIPED
jgi:hypothetical protein